jgi:hypothetical protein
VCGWKPLVGFIFIFEAGSYYVAQVGMESPGLKQSSCLSLLSTWDYRCTPSGLDWLDLKGFFLLFLFLFFKTRSHYLAQADPPAFASQILELQVCTTTPGFAFSFS